MLPNTTQTPNLLFDQFQHLLTDAELRTYLYAVRRTLGWIHHVGPKRISLSQFMNGTGLFDDDGNPVDYGTQLSRPHQVKALKGLTDFGLLDCVEPSYGRKGAKWMVTLDEDAIDWVGLRKRFDEAKARKKKRANRTKKKSQGTYKIPREKATQGTSQVPDQSTSQVPPNDAQGTYQIPPYKETKKEGNQEGGNQGWADPKLEDAFYLLLNQVDEDMRRAESVWYGLRKFMDITNLPFPNIDRKQGMNDLEKVWYPAMIDMLDRVGYSVELFGTTLTAVVAHMDTGGLTMTTPRSTQNLFNAEVARTIRIGQIPAPSGESTQGYQLDDFGA